jgi:hypothetical protein
MGKNMAAEFFLQNIFHKNIYQYKTIKLLTGMGIQVVLNFGLIPDLYEPVPFYSFTLNDSLCLYETELNFQC